MSPGQDATSVIVNTERDEHIWVTAPFENASEWSNTLLVSDANDETRNKILDEVSELSVPGTHFDRQAHTHHSTQVLLLRVLEKHRDSKKN